MSAMAINLNPLRIVTQQPGVSAAPGYRVIVYGDKLSPCTATLAMRGFSSSHLDQQYLKLDASQQLLNPLEAAEGSTVFNGEVLLSGEQLSALGLN